MEGCVFNVQKYSVHDGPGIRTIVFLKGCPLRCKWCCNPESQLAKPQIAYNPEKCIGDVCQLCAKACPAKSISLYGEYQKPSYFINKVEEDAIFYSRSEGGLTLSGGEPTMQTEFAVELLRDAKNRGITTAIETCGVIPWDTCHEVYDYLDYIHFDIKHMNSEKHKEWTGHGNEVILETFRKMREAHPDVHCIARTPIVPGFNDTEEDIIAIRDFVKQFPNTEYEVLKYHRYGTTKYDFIGREYPMGTEELDGEWFKHLKELSLQ